jgi:hypothetical protein
MVGLSQYGLLVGDFLGTLVDAQSREGPRELEPVNSVKASATRTLAATGSRYEESVPDRVALRRETKAFPIAVRCFCPEASMPAASDKISVNVASHTQ